MGTDRSAYAVLGLDATADDAAIEQAYRRLIKQFHPDRGGDAGRASEINRAYRELRAERNLHDPLDFNDDDLAPRRERNAWVLLALVLIAASLFLLLRTALISLGVGPAGLNVAPRLVAAGGSLLAPIDRPLDISEIDRAAAEAARLRQTSDEMSLAAHSRACHQALRSKPTLVQFDRCAAFDAAVVQLQDRDPLRDQGPFNELAVTGRMRSAAALLSDDSVAIDARLDRIRRQVERALEPVGST